MGRINVGRSLVLMGVLVLAAVLICSCACPFCSKGVCGQTDKVKVVVVTGGHDFEHDPFFEVFKQCPKMEVTEAVQKDHSEIFEDISNWDYDVIVLYSMTQNISPKRRENFLKLLNKGVGLVAMHHTICGFQDWPEYAKIIGAKYYLKDAEVGGVKQLAGVYKHDIDMNVHVADTEHPITKGLSDFVIHDEGYKNCWSAEDNRVLLTTDHPDSDKVLAAVRKYGKAKVCCIRLGHDSKAYVNPAFRQIAIRAIHWSAGRLK
jgi:type 1 glutamine amidotransferase